MSKIDKREAELYDMCSVVECGRTVLALGLCSRHYYRQRVGEPKPPVRGPQHHSYKQLRRI